MRRTWIDGLKRQNIDIYFLNKSTYHSNFLVHTCACTHIYIYIYISIYIRTQNGPKMDPKCPLNGPTWATRAHMGRNGGGTLYHFEAVTDQGIKGVSYLLPTRYPNHTSGTRFFVNVFSPTPAETKANVQKKHPALASGHMCSQKKRSRGVPAVNLHYY
jgi:hypothetical protein